MTMKSLPSSCAHRADDANILLQVEANFDLDAVKTLIGESARPRRHFCRLFGIERRRIDGNFIAALAAQELIDRNAADFAKDIPQRDVDAAQSNDTDAARAEFLVTTSEVSFVPDLVDLRRVHTDQQRL